MKFSSFIAVTAAGLAIAAPITPITPSNTDKQLAVEPVEIYRRQSTVSTVTDLIKGGLPVKRQLGAWAG
jgi:hypothetical protein